MVNELAKLGEPIDYIIIGSYEGLNNEIVAAAAIRQATLKLSLKRSKLQAFNYLGEDKDISIYGKTQITPLAIATKDTIDIALKRRSQGMSMTERINACLNALPKTIKSYREKRPFVTTIAMQMLLESHADVLLPKTRYTLNDISIARNCLGGNEVARREEHFMARWVPEQTQ